MRTKAVVIALIALAVLSSSFIFTRGSSPEEGSASDVSMSPSGSGGDPIYILEVVGDENFQIRSDPGGVRFFIDNSGRVGIGTTSPSASFHVAENVTIGGNLLMEGKIRHHSPVIIQDGLAFVSENGDNLFHLEVQGIENHGEVALPAALDNTFVLETHSITNLYNMEIVFWDSTNNRPALILNQGGTLRTSIFDRSLQVGKALGAATVDGNYSLFEGFNYLDGNTSLTGADLGVEDDIEAKGSIFSQENLIAEGLVIKGGAYIDNADNTFVVDNVNNRVGIGTTSPRVKLDVDGAIEYSFEKYIQRVYDFLDYELGGWQGTTANGGQSIGDKETGWYGVRRVSTGSTASNGRATIRESALGDEWIKAGDGAYVAEFRFGAINNLNDATDQYTIFIGITDINNVPLSTTDGIYFRYDDDNTDFRCVTESSDTITETTSGVIVATGTAYWGKIEINSAGTEVKFYLGTTRANMTLKATHTTNIPTVELSPYFAIEKQAGTSARRYKLDLWYHRFDLTTAR